MDHVAPTAQGILKAMFQICNPKKRGKNKGIHKYTYTIYKHVIWNNVYIAM